MSVSDNSGTRVEAPGTTMEHDREKTRMRAPGVDISVPRDKNGDQRRWNLLREMFG